MRDCVRALVVCLLLLLLRACAKKGAQQTGDGQVTVEAQRNHWGCCWDGDRDGDWWRRHPHDDSASRLQVCPSLLWSGAWSKRCVRFATLLLSTFCASFALVFVAVVAVAWTGFAVGVAVALSLSLLLLFSCLLANFPGCVYRSVPAYVCGCVWV